MELVPERYWVPEEELYDLPWVKAQIGKEDEHNLKECPCCKSTFPVIGIWECEQGWESFWKVECARCFNSTLGSSWDYTKPKEERIKESANSKMEAIANWNRRE